MGKVEGWKKIFPIELSRIDHFVDVISCLLIETRTSVGVDERVVRDVLVEGQVKLVFESFRLVLREVGVDDLRSRHFAESFHNACSGQIVRRFVGHWGKRPNSGSLTSEHGNEFSVPIGGKGAVNVEMDYCAGHCMFFYAL